MSTLISLVSHENMPNIIAAIALKPDRLAFLVTSAFAETSYPYLCNLLREKLPQLKDNPLTPVISGDECKDCMLRHNCVYSYIFETPPPQQSTVLSKLDNPPRPYVIQPPYDGKTLYRPSEEIRFGLVLIGQRAMDYL
ncbi:hypothetical protein H8E77_25465, partial [bacterium]|nr:hypothetical protein [bacterium]